MTELIRTDSENPDFHLLVQRLDAELARRDGAEHSFYAQFNKIDSLKYVVVAYENKIPAGCGAFKAFDRETVEIKRMFVQEDQRGRGIGAKILGELERWASTGGFGFAVLETGKKQPEAIHLYRKSGYELIENYGQYKGVENSVCMKKRLG